MREPLREPSPAKLRKVERILRDDIFWTIKYGPGWDPLCGAAKNGVWRSAGGTDCGVCAIGAVCVRRQPMLVSEAISGMMTDDVESAARLLGVDPWWADLLYRAVAGEDPRHLVFRPDLPIAERVRKLAERLRAHARKFDRKRERLRHEAAQEDQELAERTGLADQQHHPLTEHLEVMQVLR